MQMIISNYILKLVVDIMESTGILHYALAVLDYMHPLWKINLYNDLRMSQTIFCRKAGGDEERMVLLFFNQVGVLIWLKPDNLIDSFIFHIFFICVLKHCGINICLCTVLCISYLSWHKFKGNFFYTVLVSDTAYMVISLL